MLLIQKVLLLPTFYRWKHKTQRDDITCQSPGCFEWPAWVWDPRLLCLSALHPGIRPPCCYWKSHSLDATGNKRAWWCADVVVYLSLFLRILKWLCIFMYLFVLGYSGFTVLRQFLLYSIVTQSYIYIWTYIYICVLWEHQSYIRIYKYIYIHSFSHTIFHQILPQEIEHSSLCWLGILFYSKTPNPQPTEFFFKRGY